MEDSSKEIFLTPTGEIILKDMKLDSLPESLSKLPVEEILHLDARGNILCHLDRSILFSFSRLRCVDLRSNHVELLGDDFRCLPDLKVLRLDNNQLSSLPPSIFALQQLQVLTVSNNFICFLPKVISKLQRLSTLIVSDNQLKVLPSELGELRRIKTMFIHGNHYPEIPTSLRKLDHLQEFSLEWFRYTVPMLPRFLKGRMGEAIIASFKELLKRHAAVGKNTCNIKDFLEHFSEKSFSINRRDLRQRSLLHVAAAHGDCGVIQGLLALGVQANALDGEGLSPLVVSLKEDKIHAASILLDSDLDANIGGSHAGSALHLAVFKSETWITRNLLKKGADPNAKDCEGNTPLHILCGTFSCKKKKNTLIGDMLLQAGATVGAMNAEGYTPAHIAARRGQAAGISWLASFADLNVQGEKDKATPLHLAAHSGHLKTVLSLLENGADLIVENTEGRTPKDLAKADLAIYKLLSRTEKEKVREREISMPKTWEHQGPVRDFTLDTAQPLYLRYLGLYEIFKSGNYQDMNFAALEMEDCTVKADAVYMMSNMKNRHAGKVLEHIVRDEHRNKMVRREAKHAVHRLTADEKNTAATSLIGPKLHSKPLQMSLPMNLSHFLEEDTRVDSLMKNVL